MRSREGGPATRPQSFPRTREVHGEPRTTKRKGHAVARVMPILGVAAILAAARGGLASTRAEEVGMEVWSSARVIPSAWVSRPGPAQRIRLSRVARRRHIAGRPCTGSKARTRTAVACPGGPATRLAHQWTP